MTDKRTALQEVVNGILRFGRAHPSPHGGDDRGPVVLILDKEVQQIPFEAMDILENQVIAIYLIGHSLALFLSLSSGHP